MWLTRGHSANSIAIQRDSAASKKTITGHLTNAKRSTVDMYHKFSPLSQLNLITIECQLPEITSTIHQHQSSSRRRSAPMRRMGTGSAALAAGVALLLALAGCSLADELAKEPRATQPTIDHQLGSPNLASAPVASSSQAPSGKEAASQVAAKAIVASVQGKPTKQQASTSSRKAAAVSNSNYDKYQLKASSSHSASAMASHAPSSAVQSSGSEPESSPSTSTTAAASEEPNKRASPAAGQRQKSQTGSGSQSSGFAILKRLFPSLMGPMTAAAAAAASAVVDKGASSPNSRSSGSAADSLVAKASGRLVNMITSRRGAQGHGLVPDHAPFFVRQKSAIDRQSGFASGILSDPLKLGLLFSAPLIPSLLLTPLAIAGLSPAMSAINNFLGDDDEKPENASPTGPLSALTGGSGALGSLLQANGATGSSGSPSFAMQAMQTFLGPTSTTERPLFNPGMFASAGIQNAASSLANAAPSPAPVSGSSSSSSNSPIKSLFGGSSLMQAAASMISPSFASPSDSGSSSSSSSSDDGPSVAQDAWSVFDKVASYMNPDREVAQASGASASLASPSTGSGSSASSSSSPLAALVGLSSFSPFQLSSLFSSSPIATAASQPSSSGSSSAHIPRAGFLSTLKNVYELFSSSFLRRQEVGDSNECQQRLICELHQRAMNSKLFRRSIQANLMELAQLDRSLQEQLRPLEARVDSDTKAMLNDFLKASNSFKSGHELVNCGQMFPRCSRTMLLSAANAHLSDSAGAKTVGKFASLMKKMKFKTAQQHQSQWKAQKLGRVQQVTRPQAPAAPQYQPTDYLQVAPLHTVNGKPTVGQLTPADSLKLVQKIMLMSQQQQQQQQLQQSTPAQTNVFPQQPASGAMLYASDAYPLATSQAYGQQSYQSYTPSQYQGAEQSMGQLQQQQQQSQAQSQSPSPSQSSSLQQYGELMPPRYAATESPYFVQQQQQQQQQQQVAEQQQASQMIQQQQPVQYQQYPTSTSMVPDYVTPSEKKLASVGPKVGALAA